MGHTCKIEFPVQERCREHTYTCLVNVFCNKRFMCMDVADIWHITKLCEFMHVALLTEGGFCPSPISARINCHVCLLRWPLKCS